MKLRKIKHKKNLREKLISNKKGISEVIGYIMLVSIVIVVAGIVYTWMKSYVPKEVEECKDEVSLIMNEYSYNSDADTFQINVSNSGRFAIEGYFIRASYDSNVKIAKIDLSGNLVPTDSNIEILDYIKFIDSSLQNPIDSKNALLPGEKVTSNFINMDQIPKFIEILPIRYEEIEGKEKRVNCGNDRKNYDMN